MYSTHNEIVHLLGRDWATVTKSDIVHNLLGIPIVSPRMCPSQLSQSWQLLLDRGPHICPRYDKVQFVSSVACRVVPTALHTLQLNGVPQARAPRATRQETYCWTTTRCFMQFAENNNNNRFLGSCSTRLERSALSIILYWIMTPVYTYIVHCRLKLQAGT